MLEHLIFFIYWHTWYFCFCFHDGKTTNINNESIASSAYSHANRYMSFYQQLFYEVQLLSRFKSWLFGFHVFSAFFCQQIFYKFTAAVS